jgi:diguanylate cyclase (GGDEF)-like protein/PAS domain S-box-containing protein
MILDCNQGLCEVTGYSKEELVGMNGLLLIMPEQRDYVIDKIKSGYELPYESVGVRKNGELYPVRIEGRNIPYNGRKVRVTEFRDITESKKTENELIKSERRLDLAMSVKNEGIWDWDLETNTVEFDDRYYLMAGYTPKEFPYKLEEFLSRVHSDDVSMVMSNAEDYISGKRSDFQVEFRFLCRDKSWIWIEGKGKIFEYFKDGKPKRFVGTHTDISERKSAEMSLKKSEERFRIAQDMSPDGFTILHPVRNEKGEVIDFTFVYENKSIAQINQSEPEKVIGKSLLELYPDHRGTPIFESYASVANTGVYRIIDEVYVGQVISKPVWLRLVVFSIQENIAILAQNISQFKKNEKSILYASKHDFLTGLPNRRYFDEKIKEFDKPENYPLLISMIDIDGLKLINDTYGHQIGDQAIIQVANLLTECCTEPAFISRIGGDEFLIISPLTTVAEFKEKRNKLLTKISQIKIKEISLSLSFGATIKTDQSVGIDDTITDAENNMYANKVIHSQSSRNQTINAIFESLKEKYDEERIHSDRVSQFCALMGEKLQLSQNDQLELRLAGRMHDIGKITIPDHILKKPGKLTDEEWTIMKSHTTNGYQILRSADQYSRLADYALTHHERYDGKGYPQGLKGEDIPLYSRIIAICDTYEAMTADRPYRKALTKEVAIAELKRCAGTQFDPRLVEVFVNEVVSNEVL